VKNIYRSIGNLALYTTCGSEAKREIVINPERTIEPNYKELFVGWPNRNSAVSGFDIKSSGL
jgi:hypothetical protein